MPKYRTLHRKELETMKDEFVKYLILNGLDVDEWLRIKKDESDRASQLIDDFSDMVLGRVLTNVKYLDLYTPSSIKTYKCDEKEMTLIALETEDEGYDFTTAEGIARAQSDPPADLKIYTTKKEYTDDRELEIYMMTVAGATISQGKLYESLMPLASDI